MREPRSSFVDTDTTRLHYLEWEPAYLHQELTEEANEDTSDGDDVPLILLHALGATADFWRPWAGISNPII
jgi:pimeloyl-ACP methyl ester carboxylesterase